MSSDFKYCATCGANNLPGRICCFVCGSGVFRTAESHEKLLAKRKGDWQQTYTGRIVYPLDPRPEDIDIRDIAHALSHQCRFGGHSRFHYSVAQHSLAVHELIHCYEGNEPPDDLPEDTDDIWVSYELTALLHDASEAYLIDVPRPLKPSLPEYKTAEEAWEKAIAERYKLIYPMPKTVKWADNAVLAAERDALFGVQAQPWAPLPEPPTSIRVIRRMTPEDAEAEFLTQFYSLIAKIETITEVGL
jgi:hypothetical protein